jgi:hypothetical protein
MSSKNLDVIIVTSSVEQCPCVQMIAVFSVTLSSKGTSKYISYCHEFQVNWQLMSRANLVSDVKDFTLFIIFATPIFSYIITWLI